MRRLPHAVAALCLAASTGLAAAGGAGAAPAPATGAHRVTGVSLPSYHYDVGALQAYERATGHDVDVLQTFISWHYAGQPSLSDFPAYRAGQVGAAGAELEVTWDPGDPARGAQDPDLGLAGIARGDDDAYVRRFAQAVKDFRRPVRIRFGHEANGTWVSWNEANSGNHPGDFARAWRHVHDVFAAVGATNATWVWSMNVLPADGRGLARLYPGDAYVDEVGVDGYSYPRSGCPSPSALFDPTLAAVRSITSRPVRLTEVGVATTCPGRAAWVAALGDWVVARDVRGLTWWERASAQADYRLVGTPAQPALKTLAGRL